MSGGIISPARHGVRSLASGFKPLASAELLERGENWAPLALSNGKLLIRGQKNLKAVQVAQ